jgi:putative nucleotidyltransferase with HDIG domain
MSSGSPRRTRGDRVSALELPPGKWASLFQQLQRGPVLLRLAICALVAIILWAATRGWYPPLEYRLGEIPHRHVVARVTFDEVNVKETERLREEARQQATAVYDQNPAPLVECKARVLNELTQLSRHLFARLRTDLPTTLTRNEQLTLEAKEKAAEQIEEKMIQVPRGTVLAEADVPIGEEQFKRLKRGHQELLASMTWQDKLYRSLAVFGMYLAVFTLCGFYIAKHEPRILQDLQRFIVLIATVLLTVILMLVTFSRQVEVIPLVMFAMTMSIAYSQAFALLMSTAVTLIGATSLGMDLHEAIVLMATAAGAIIVLDSVRTRSKLAGVGLVAAVVAFLTNLGVGTLQGDPFLPTLQVAMRLALWAVIAGAIMSVILPLIERIYNVQTDLSLLELGDPSLPLLQELVRRAPGTYNHSINVASLAESAAEAIGARGLLVRVGAYYHDIGKMLKPGYFVENQSHGSNRHDALVPAMSTLVIIAHVKDGADLARQHRLPEPIIDFIQQHHGTTLVEYFYRQATDRKEQDPDAPRVDESAFRYPGPKPQTKEAGVLMLADAVESASRVLVEPTPARIENLVEEISRKRLLDGQFDECGLTLEEVSKIGESLVKSLTAVYHGRVKYPGQERA